MGSCSALFRFAKQHADRHTRIRLSLEEVEERIVPTAWVVGDNSDSPTDPNSLRYILAHVANGNTIGFASTVTNITLTTAGGNTTGPIVDANVSINGGGTVTINGPSAGLTISFALGANNTAQGTFTSAINNKITGTYTATFTGTIVGGKHDRGDGQR